MKSPLTAIPLPAVFFHAPIAHRGLHDCNGSFGSGRTENSYSAFQSAVNKGYGIELDIQLSADLVPVVFHDNDLKRLLKVNKKVSDLQLKSLKELRLKNYEEILTLDEFLELICGKVPILVELKDQDGFLGRSTGLIESAVASCLKEYNGPVAVMSFNPNYVKEFGLRLPHVPRGLVTESFNERDWPKIDSKKLTGLRSLKKLEEVAASFISHKYSDLNSKFVTQISKKIKIFSWTIRDKRDLAVALRRSDNVTFEGFMP